MDKVVDFLSKFEVREHTEFVNSLDEVYFKSFQKGQNATLDKLKGYFLDKNDQSLPRDIVEIKQELDATIASRVQIDTEPDKKVEYRTEHNGYLSGNISILNECYTYLLRYSTHLAKSQV